MVSPTIFCAKTGLNGYDFLIDKIKQVKILLQNRHANPKCS